MKRCILCEQGQAEFSIQTGENPPEQVAYAARELSSYLGLMSGASFEVAPIARKKPIMLQLTDDANLLEDGYRIKSSEATIHIEGGRRGVIYGVYEFLQMLGCRFFTPTCEKIPTADPLEFPIVDICTKPVLEYREHNYRDAVRHPRFAVKSRLNGSHHKIIEKYGGHLSYAWFVHTFDRIAPPEQYGASHPEYYALVDGVRDTTKHQSQLCLTNPDVVELGLRSVRQALLENPKARLISISQNDWEGACTCKACQKIDREEGSPSGTMLRYVNAIAQALENDFPDVVFDTLAYMYTRRPPRVTRPRPNVCVRLCSIECCFAHPFEECEDETRRVRSVDGTTSSFINDLKAWGRICNRMYIWDYTTCFAHYPTPHPNWAVLQPNMQAFVKNGVKGVFEQANGALGGGTDLNELRAYVISKLLWDADTDVQQHIREFTDEYYGKAAPMIREYMDVLTKKVERDRIHVGFNDHPTASFLDEKMLDAYERLFDQAQEAVKGSPLHLHRVAKARLSIRYVRLKRANMLKGETDVQALRDFFVDWKAYGLTRIDEWVSEQTTHRAFLDRKWRGTQYYEHWSEEGGEEY